MSFKFDALLFRHTECSLSVFIPYLRHVQIPPESKSLTDHKSQNGLCPCFKCHEINLVQHAYHGNFSFRITRIAKIDDADGLNHFHLLAALLLVYSKHSSWSGCHSPGTP